MDTWIKVYRKIGQHELITDSKAFTVFIVLLTLVDKTNGTFDIGRFQGASMFRLSASTFYKVLKRLDKKYNLVTLSSNNKYTTVSVLKWAKYQPDTKTVTQGGNNKVTTKEQQSNTKQEYKNRELLSKDNNVNDAPLKTSGIKREPEIDHILASYKKYMGHTPTDRRPRFVGHNLRKAIKKMLITLDGTDFKDSYENVVERSMKWYSDKYQETPGESLNVVYRKVTNLLIPATLKKYDKQT